MKANDVPILDLIEGKKKTFIIPPFQRNYEWTKEQCEELFDDIKIAYETKRTHYLGNVVYYRGENSDSIYNELILVDGQQRITTILLLICAIRDLSEDEDIKQDINDAYLKNRAYGEAFRVKLKQTAYDEDNFVCIVEGDSSNLDKNSNIAKNYAYFVELLRKNEKSPKDILDALQYLLVIDVNLSSGETITLDAVQTIFEKINSTGKKLEPADLIRNYLLLTKNSNMQEDLYNKYWINIEKEVTNEQVSRFTRDYLIMKIYEDVPENSIYKKFKTFCTNKEKKNILKELNDLSKYYAWIKFEKCPDEKINQIIQYLNILRTDDLYSLYLFLFKVLYKENRDELCKILNLLSDFMLRYRIVSPAGGGGALRAAIHSLIDDLDNNDINATFDGILKVLSNSKTLTARYPDDEEFKKALMNSNSLNYKYAKVLLLKLENSETKNIPVNISSVTIEHLMPQTLSKLWIEYLGGKESAEQIYEEYINCIGNLTPMSAGYNSKNSNKPWSDKLLQIKDVQFRITNQITKYKEWKEDAIVDRNIDIAERACKVTTSPLKRTQDYSINEIAEEFTPGLYRISDIFTPMSGEKPVEVFFDDKEHYMISSWKEFLNRICEIAYNFDSKLLEKIVEENMIHKSTSKKNKNGNDPIITKNKTYLNDPLRIGKSDFYVEGNIGSDRARFYAKKLLDVYEITDFCKVYVENS